MKRISSGMAAQSAGVDRVVFLLGLDRVAMIALSEEDLAFDAEHAYIEWDGNKHRAINCAGCGTR